MIFYMNENTKTIHSERHGEKCNVDDSTKAGNITKTTYSGSALVRANGMFKPCEICLEPPDELEGD